MLFSSRLFLMLVSLAGAIFSTSLYAAASGATIRESRRLLTQDYAMFRASQVSNITYALDVSIDPESDIFQGQVSIRFDYTGNNQAPLTLDFDQGEILSFSVNGQDAQYEYDKWFITFGSEQLVAGSNHLVIDYRRPYTTDGDGLHKFIDPENGEIYLYTNFEPYNANRFFPLFDQPNLKAPFTLTAHVPANWEVISNQRETSHTLNGDSQTWTFPPTPPISSYLYSFHAGPFKVWEDRSGDIALRLFARTSLADYVDVEEWFTPTKQFLPFFQTYFDVPYPLNKYDQIIVPDFNPGAMENLGAVTFNEAYLNRGEKTIREKSRLAYVIAHEMAHMWFGDLVTMNWWNDLWLNESFATYMGYLALDSASDFENAWDIFYSRDKSRAYVADARVTTHPIALEAANTADAVANFDLITYQKGSSVLKQLPYFIGEENFRRGVSQYLKEHSFANARLDDFVASLETASGIDLTRWQQEWLQASGANTITTDFSCQDNEVTSLRLIQSVPATSTADKVLRSQRTRLGLYRYVDGTMVLGQALPVTYDGVVTWVPEVIGQPCPDMVFPNLDDHAYLVINFDPVSLQTLQEHINHFSSTTTRLMLWESLWSGVRDARLSLDDFLGFAFDNIGDENDANVVRQVSGNIASAYNYYSAFGDHADKLVSIQAFVWQALENAEPGSEIQKIWYDNFIARAHTRDALDYITALLAGTESIESIVIDQDKRWDIIVALNHHLHGDYAALLVAETMRDTSDLGVNSSLAARASRPDPVIKEAFIDEMLADPLRYKLASMRFITRNLYPNNQLPLMENVADKVIAAIPVLNESADEGFVDEFMVILPATCTPESVSRLDQLARTLNDYPALITRSVLVTLQEDRRCVSLKSLVSNAP